MGGKKTTQLPGSVVSASASPTAAAKMTDDDEEEAHLATLRPERELLSLPLTCVRAKALDNGRHSRGTYSRRRRTVRSESAGQAPAGTDVEIFLQSLARACEVRQGDALMKSEQRGAARSNRRNLTLSRIDVVLVRRRVNSSSTARAHAHELCEAGPRDRSTQPRACTSAPDPPQPVVSFVGRRGAPARRGRCGGSGRDSGRSSASSGRLSTITIRLSMSSDVAARSNEGRKRLAGGPCPARDARRSKMNCGRSGACKALIGVLQRDIEP